MTQHLSRIQHLNPDQIRHLQNQGLTQLLSQTRHQNLTLSRHPNPARSLLQNRDRYPIRPLPMTQPPVQVETMLQLILSPPQSRPILRMPNLFMTD